jgi:hypothetical protein
VVISVLTDKGCPPDVDSKTESIMDTVAHPSDLGMPGEAMPGWGIVVGPPEASQIPTYLPGLVQKWKN